MSLAVQYSFNGAVVVISGAASGVGAATARACAEYGAKVVAIDVNAAGLAALTSITGIETPFFSKNKFKNSINSSQQN